jgi:glycosyltransferase involved in cell wall biosynthesis
MTADTVGGVWTYALELADALGRRGTEVHLATMGRHLDRPQRAALRRSAVAEAYESDYKLEWMDEPWRDVDRAGGWLLECESAGAPDVVHLNGYAHGVLPFAAPVVVVAHSCVLSWWRAVKATPAPARLDRYRDRVAAGLHAADAVVAPTAAMLAELGRLYGLSGGAVVHNGRSSGWVRQLDKEPIILGAGRVWDEAKNLRQLEAVSSSLPWPVVIAGAPAGPGSAGPHGCEGARFLGELPFPKLAAWLLRAKIFVAPVRYEPFGLGAVEAGLAGCAVVVGDIPAMHEVWGPAAVYVAPDDPEGLVSTLRELCADQERLAQLGALARQRASLFTTESMAAGYARIYSRLPARAGGQR